MNIRSEAEVNKVVDDIVKTHGKINGLVVSWWSKTTSKKKKLFSFHHC